MAGALNVHCTHSSLHSTCIALTAHCTHSSLHSQLIALTAHCTHSSLHSQLIALTAHCTHSSSHSQLIALTAHCTHSSLHSLHRVLLKFFWKHRFATRDVIKLLNKAMCGFDLRALLVSFRQNMLHART